MNKALLFRSLLSIVLLHYPSICFANTSVLIRAKHTDPMEFLAYTETEIVKTYAQSQLNQIRKSPRPIHLDSLLKKSQMEFLSHDPSRAKKTYQLIVDHLHSFDWNKEERKIILYSLLRLAQLEKDKQKQNLFLHEALTFGFDVNIDLNIFPPPLTKTYLQMKKEQKVLPVALENLFPHHELILMNGRPYASEKKISLPYGTYRITAFSSSHEPWTKIISLSQLISKRVKTKALVGGDCQNVIVEKKLQIANKRAKLQALFPNFCLSDLSQKKMNKLKTEFENMEIDLQNPNVKKHKKEQKWLWFGLLLVAGVGTTFFVLSSRDKERANSSSNRQKKTIRYGF